MYAGDGLHSVLEIVEGVVFFVLVGTFLGRCTLFYDVAVYLDCLVYLEAVFEEFVLGGLCGLGGGRSQAWAFDGEGAFFYFFGALDALPVFAVTAL